MFISVRDLAVVEFYVCLITTRMIMQIWEISECIKKYDPIYRYNLHYNSITNKFLQVPMFQDYLETVYKFLVIAQIPISI